MLSTVVIVIVILVYSRENSSSNTFVWKSFNDDTGLNNTNIPYVCLIGLLTSCYGFSGYEAGGHMAEETKNS
jgi:amino acid transporter